MWQLVGNLEEYSHFFGIWFSALTVGVLIVTVSEVFEGKVFEGKKPHY